MDFLLTLILGAIALVFALLLVRLLFQCLLAGGRYGCFAMRAVACLALAALAVLSPGLALAATSAPAQTVDLTPIWSWALSLAIAVSAFYGRRALIAIEGRLRIQSGSAAADDLDQALVHGEAFLIAGLKALAASTSTVTIAAGPLANAVALVRKLAPAAEVALGVTPADIEAILLARIGVPAQVVPKPDPAPDPTPAINPAPAPAS
ncbi:MAG TPA: hypothetical protein VL356_02565 [Acidocella sp.]|jgi:hypothetical protein|nr:hypothetical protein [Acidocella sp.]